MPASKPGRKNFEIAKAQTELGILEQKDLVNSILTDPIARLQRLQDGVLTISDRRIDINEPIIVGSGDWFARRVNFFNKDQQKNPFLW